MVEHARARVGDFSLVLVATDRPTLLAGQGERRARACALSLRVFRFLAARVSFTGGRVQVPAPMRASVSRSSCRSEYTLAPAFALNPKPKPREQRGHRYS